MKKFCVAFLTLFSPFVYSLPVDNPASASLFTNEEFYFEECFCSQIHWGFGFYGDYVFNRHMETVNDRDIDTTQIVTNSAFLVANFFERVDVFATFGASRLSLNTSLGAFNAVDPHPLFEIESETAFSYSGGLRATIWEINQFSLGIMGQYFATEPRIKRMYIASGAVSYPDDILKTRYSEWQIAAGLTYRYNDFFLPYLAIKYANAFWKLDDGRLFIIESNTNTFLFNLESQRNWGYAIGLTFCPPVYEKLFVTVEARFPDEKALYVNAQMRF